MNAQSSNSSSSIDRPDGLSVLDIAAAALHYRRLIVGAGVTLALLLAVWVLKRPRTYTSVASFTPQASRSQLSGLGGLAAQFGMAIPTADNNQSPQFYADLLQSRTILEPLSTVVAQFETADGPQRGTFADFARIRVTDTLLRRENTIVALRAATNVSVNPRTGVVRVEVKTPFPALSVILADSALHLLNRFNVETRRSQAAAQRNFLDERLATVSNELREAEAAVADFARRNRVTQNSPDLQTQQDRLARAVTIRSQVYATLAQALEQAKLDEIRDTPLITVIEPPRTPALPDPRRLVLTTLIGFIVGAFLGLVVALVRHATDVARRQRPDSFTSFETEVVAAKSELRRVWPFGRLGEPKESGAGTKH